MYKIVQAPDEILRLAAKSVDLSMTGLPEIIKEMRLTLLMQKNPEGVGLAANQVGLPHKIFLTHFVPSKSEPVRVFINPEIVAHSEEFQIETKKSPLEGCLSLPKYYGSVKRYQWIEIKYQDETGAEKQEKYEGFPAVVIQHEMDHLNGKIFVERILEQKGKMYKINGKDDEGKETWEEVEL